MKTSSNNSNNINIAAVNYELIQMQKRIMYCYESIYLKTITYMRCLRINMTFLYLYYPILLINAETNPQRICNKSKLFKAHHTLFYILELYFVKLATVFVLIMCIVKKNCP